MLKDDLHGFFYCWAQQAISHCFLCCSSHKVKVFPLFIHRGIYDGSLVVLITQIKLTKVSQVKFNPCLSPEMKVISLCERGFCMSDITSKWHKMVLFFFLSFFFSVIKLLFYGTCIKRFTFIQRSLSFPLGDRLIQVRLKSDYNCFICFSLSETPIKVFLMLMFTIFSFYSLCLVHW